MNTSDVRYAMLKENFRDQPNVKRGYKEFKVLKRKYSRTLKHLLRDHREEEITSDKEVQFRDDMDFLIGYYNVLMCAILTKYVSPELPTETSREAIEVLRNPAVLDYYTKYYPLELPQILSDFIIHGNDVLKQWKVGRRITRQDDIFEELIQLFRSRIEDEEIDAFLFLLDDGLFYDDEVSYHQSIYSLLQFLELPQRMEARDMSEGKTALMEKLIWGFAKYINYLDAYAAILHKANRNHHVRAALWMLDSYWFERLQTKIGDRLVKVLQNIQLLINAGYHSVSMMDDLVIVEKWRKESQASIRKSLNNIEFLQSISRFSKVEAYALA